MYTIRSLSYSPNHKYFVNVTLQVLCVGDTDRNTDRKRRSVREKQGDIFNHIDLTFYALSERKRLVAEWM